mmetsp:Transcript_7129/g.11683  ORF Transcript_7129/g.11683 Transcript_7129/m.11683 type:complete len:347 (-) Transcript_7129:2122-3162(-)
MEASNRIAVDVKGLHALVQGLQNQNTPVLRDRHRTRPQHQTLANACTRHHASFRHVLVRHRRLQDWYNLHPVRIITHGNHVIGGVNHQTVNGRQRNRAIAGRLIHVEGRCVIQRHITQLERHHRGVEVEVVLPNRIGWIEIDVDVPIGLPIQLIGGCGLVGQGDRPVGGCLQHLHRTIVRQGILRGGKRVHEGLIDDPVVQIGFDRVRRGKQRLGSKLLISQRGRTGEPDAGEFQGRLRVAERVDILERKDRRVRRRAARPFQRHVLICRLPGIAEHIGRIVRGDRDDFLQPVRVQLVPGFGWFGARAVVPLVAVGLGIAKRLRPQVLGLIRQRHQIFDNRPGQVQ